MSIRSVCAVLTAVVGLTISSVSAMDFGIGVKGGLNLAKIYGDEYYLGYGSFIDAKMKPGFAGGAAFQFKFGKHFALRPEILFSSKGFKADVPNFGGDIFDDGGDDLSDLLDDFEDLVGDDYLTVGQLDYLDLGDLGVSTVEGQFSIKYIEIPILFDILFPIGEKVTPSIYVGPSVAFRVGVSGKMDDEDIPDNMVDSIKEQLSVFDLGMTMGIGFGIKAGPGKFTIDARYTLGLLSIYDSDAKVEDPISGQSVEIDKKDKNMALTFMGGYMFEF